MAETKTLKIGIAGSGNRSQGYARALGQVEGARVTAAAASNRLAVDLQRTIPGVAIERDVGGLIRRANVDAVVFADPVVDLPAIIRRALLADKHVLATISSPVTCTQLDELASLARRRQRMLMFTEERSFHPALVFLKWMLSGRSGLWQPRYIRAVSAPGTGNGSGGPSIATLIVEELAICGRLLGESPVSVSGIVCRVEAEAMPAAAFVNLLYADGRVASLQASTTEAQESRQWALATSSKTVLLDECDVRSPVKIISLDSETAPGSLLRVNPPVPLAEWPTESTVTPPLRSTDTKVDQCRHFVESILNHELCESNAEFWADVALVWEAVQESVRLEGMPASINAASEREKRAVGERPKLRLIRGKGMGTVDARKRPALTLVPR
jgi:predicted dehydrogenase